MRHSLRLLFLLVACAMPLPALARPVRVFVVNPRLELRYADTYASFRDKMFTLVDASHPRRAELVQADVLDIAAHRRPRDAAAPADALIVFPEDVGLIAGLIGSRGRAGARGDPGGGRLDDRLPAAGPTAGFSASRP